MPGFSSSYSPLILFIFLLVSAFVSYWFFRNSLLSPLIKYILITVKGLGLFLLLALFIEPVISYLVSGDDEPLNIVLIDNSRSNDILNKSGEIKRIIEDNNLTGSGFELFTFSNELKELSSLDSLSHNGYETSLTDALKLVKSAFPDRTFNSVTVVSDAIFTSGGNPLYEAKTFQAPFITYAIGDSAQHDDIVLKDISYNKSAFTNKPVKVKAFINPCFSKPLSISVKLLREGSLLNTVEVKTDGRNPFAEAEFSITESAEAKVKYRIEITPADGELTEKNNYRDFYITFTDNKVNLLVVSGGPGYDNEFIGSVLKRIGNYNVTYRTAKTGTEFYEGSLDRTKLPELSAVLFLNYPTSQTQLNSDLTASITQHNIPLIFFSGKSTDYQKLGGLEELLPFGIARPNSGETQLSLLPVSTEDNPLSKINGISTTAQIFKNVSGIQPKPGAVVLATDRSTGEPVMITRTSGKTKSTAFLGYGLWRWRLNPAGDGEKLLEALMLESINMTLQKEKKTRFRVYPSKDVFDHLESGVIYAEVFDENFVPTRNAKVEGVVKDKTGNKKAELKFEADENRFKAVLPLIGTGDYTIEASCESGGVYVASDVNRFSVDTVNLEYMETKTDNNALRELSQNTGGKYVERDAGGELGSIIRDTKNPAINQQQAEKHIKFNLWENKYYLILIILLFSIEWILRKRNNIA